MRTSTPGPVIEAFSIEERLTVCNMSIEGGARCGYVNPDETTIAYLRGRPVRARGRGVRAGGALVAAMRSDPDARYADRVELDGEPTRAVGDLGDQPGPERGGRRDAAARGRPARRRARVGGRGLRLHEPAPGRAARRHRGRRLLHRLVHERPDQRPARGRARRAHRARSRPGVRALVVPGSQAVARQAEAEGLPEVFRSAGFEWREPGCSMCLAMNPDKLVGRELCASSSNRNFKGRQGSPTGRTLLDVARDGRGGGAARRGRRRAGDPLDGRAHRARARAAAACCAATTSTPTGSSRRASCAASCSTASASTRSRTIARRRRAITRSTTRASRARAC